MVAKKRRRALVKEFMQLKKVQSHRNIKMLERHDEILQRVTSNRNLSIRERLSLKSGSQENILAGIIRSG